MKESFSNTLSDLSGATHMMNECEKYGMTYGCDVDCPVLRAGECELQDSDNKELYQSVKKKKKLNYDR